MLLPGNLIVLSPEWFWQDVINWQLSPEQRGRLGARTTGVYALEDFQARCPCPAGQALQALQAVNLCIQVSPRRNLIHTMLSFVYTVKLLYFILVRSGRRRSRI